MAMESPHQVVLSDPDRRVLLQRARSARRPHREVLRAAIVLAAAEGMANAAIARRLGVCVDTVRKWRARFCARGLPGLADRPRPGRRPERTGTDEERAGGEGQMSRDKDRVRGELTILLGSVVRTGGVFLSLSAVTIVGIVTLR
jgi:transposase-like protein